MTEHPAYLPQPSGSPIPAGPWPVQAGPWEAPTAGQWPGPAQLPARPAQMPAHPAQRPAYPAQRPAYPAQRPAPPAVPEGALAEIRQLLFSSIPDTAVAHSFHVAALMNPAIRDNAEFQRFSEVELNELHHQVAALGCLYRMQQGDPEAASCLATNLQGFLDNRLLGLQLAQQLPAQITQNPNVQTMTRLVGQTQQAVQQHMPAIQSFVAAVRAPNPGPMLVGGPGAPVPY